MWTKGSVEGMLSVALLHSDLSSGWGNRRELEVKYMRE